VVLYEMTTGERPFQSRNLQELTQLITTGRFPPPSALNPELPPALEQIILTAMASNREDRFPSASAMAETLRGLQLRPPTPNPPTPLPEMNMVGEMEKIEGLNPTTHTVPKRPQAAFPRFLGLDLPQLPVAEPAGPATDKSETEPQVHLDDPQASDYDTSPELPAQIRPSDQPEEFASLPEIPLP
jgi:serine/threonine protein kinase